MKAISRRLTLALTLSLSPPSFANLPERSATEQERDAARARARLLFEEGARAFDARRFQGARDALRESFDIHPSYDTAGLLGQTEIALGEYRSAAEHLDYCLRHFPTGENAELFEQVKIAYSAVRNQVGTLEINVNVDGARVFVNDELVGKSPLGRKVFVEQGHHVVRVQANDEAPFQRALSVARGSEEIVDVTLKGAPSALSSTDAVGRGGAAAQGLARSSAPARAGEPGARSWVPAYVLGGVTVASLATSLVFRGRAASDDEDVDRLRGEAPDSCTQSDARSCDALRDAARSHDRNAGVANVTLAIAGVGAAATAGYVVYTLLQPSSDAPVRGAVAFDGAGARLLVSGSF